MGIPDSFKVGWYRQKITGSTDLFCSQCADFFVCNVRIYFVRSVRIYLVCSAFYFVRYVTSCYMEECYQERCVPYRLPYDRDQTANQQNAATVDSCFELVGSRQHSVAQQKSRTPTRVEWSTKYRSCVCLQHFRCAVPCL